MHKYLLVILAITQMIQCHRGVGGEKTDNGGDKTIHVEVYRATSQQWVGGAVGSGKGIKYRFYLPIEDDVFDFDSVWVAGYRLEAKKLIDELNPDTLIVTANLFIGGDAPGLNGNRPSSSVKAEQKFFPTCTAVLRFIEKSGAAALTCANNIVVLPKLNYQ